MRLEPPSGGVARRAVSLSCGEPRAFGIGEDGSVEGVGLGSQPPGAHREVCSSVSQVRLGFHHSGARGGEGGGGREVGGGTLAYRPEVAPSLGRNAAAGGKDREEQDGQKTSSRRPVVQVPCSVPAASVPLLAWPPDRGKRQAKPTNERMARTTTIRPTI